MLRKWAAVSEQVRPVLAAALRELSVQQTGFAVLATR
jgi:hypothetical protein